MSQSQNSLLNARSIVVAAVSAFLLLSGCSGGSATLLDANGASVRGLTPVSPLNFSTDDFSLQAIDVFAHPHGVLFEGATAKLTTTAGGFDFMVPNRVGGNDTYIFDTTHAPGEPYHYLSCGQAAFCGMRPDYLHVIFTGGEDSGLSYATYGQWVRVPALIDIQILGVFVGGVQPSGRPLSGTASYGGKAAGFITTPGPNILNTYSFAAKVGLIADFAANTISGALTAVSTTKISSLGVGIDKGVSAIANDVALTGGTITGMSFRGNAATLPAAPGTTFDLSGASGGFGGAFYGPNAAEAAGSLSMTSSSATVIAAFGVKK